MNTFASPINESKRVKSLDGLPEKFDFRSVMHVFMLATAFWVFSWSVALDFGIIGGVVGTVFGAIWGQVWSVRRYRLPAILGFSVLVAGLGRILTLILGDATWFSLVVSPALSFQIIDAIQWGTLFFAAAAIIRALSVRYRAALALEGLVVVAAVATTVSAHRDGMIARPLKISDWFWTQGIDPVIAFLLVGLLGGLLLAGILAHGRSRGRTLVQLGFVFLLGLFLVSQLYETDQAPDPRSAAGGKLEQDDDSRSSNKGGGNGSGQQGEGQASRGNEKGDSPFSGGMPKADSSPSNSKKNSPAAVVIFHRDVKPSMGIYYFRHAIFSQFNGDRLVEPTDARVPRGEGRDFPTRRRLIEGPHEFANGREMVATDVALLRDHARMFTLTDAVEVSPNQNPSPARFKRSYHVVSNLVTVPYKQLAGSASGDDNWSDVVWNHYTALPRDERYHRLAAQIQGSLRAEFQDDSFALAMGVKNYLESNATYSFKKSYKDEADPTAAFLFSEDMIGYCVHLSHSAAYLLRAMGVPARVSAGYAVESKRLSGGASLLVRSADAHAWAEIYLRGYGWIPIEITPEKTDTEPDPFAEKDLQQLLGEMARNAQQKPPPPDGLNLKNLLDSLRSALPWVVAFLLLACYAWKTWRLLSPQWRSAAKRPRLAYRAALDRLSAVGHSRGYGESRERFATRTETVSPSIRPLTSIHLATALGSTQARFAERELQNIHEVSASVGRELRASVPWWRWTLGLINPVSWIWSR